MAIHNNPESEVQKKTNSPVEDLLYQIIARLDRIEHQIDSAIYPDESFFRKDFIFHVKEQKMMLDNGEGCVYLSMNEFLESLE